MMTAEELSLRRLVVCASGLVYWGGVWLHARRVRRQIGRSPNLKPRGAKERVLWLGWFLVILVWVGQPWLVEINARNPVVGLIPALVHPEGLVSGLALVVLGYAATRWAYVAMGDAWRIGINVKEKNVLISRGPYRWVRHPIYLFQIVLLAGAALLLPTPLSFAVLLTHYVCVSVKASDEEKYQTTVHGSAYRDYLARTGGLFPRLAGRRLPPATDGSRD